MSVGTGSYSVERIFTLSAGAPRSVSVHCQRPLPILDLIASPLHVTFWQDASRPACLYSGQAFNIAKVPTNDCLSSGWHLHFLQFAHRTAQIQALFVVPRTHADARPNSYFAPAHVAKTFRDLKRSHVTLLWIVTHPALKVCTTYNHKSF